MRLATLEQDCWELASGEERHRENPDGFWILPRSERESLHRGQGAKLIFLIEGEEDDGSTTAQGERMWVLVSERRGSIYLGILDNEPALVEGGGDWHLVRGAEIPFRAEHIIDIEDPPPGYAAERLAEPPARRWPPDRMS
jgi:hypothetical protein